MPRLRPMPPGGAILQPGAIRARNAPLDEAFASIPMRRGFERERRRRRLQQQSDDGEDCVNRAAAHEGTTIVGLARWRISFPAGFKARGGKFLKAAS